jgi:hypothetical protein
MQSADHNCMESILNMAMHGTMPDRVKFDKSVIQCHPASSLVRQGELDLPRDKRGSNGARS